MLLINRISLLLLASQLYAIQRFVSLRRHACNMLEFMIKVRLALHPALFTYGFYTVIRTYQ